MRKKRMTWLAALLALCIMGLSAPAALADAKIMDTYASPFQYAVDGVIVGYRDKISGPVTIPTQISWVTIHEIGDGAFQYATSLQAVNISQGIVTIGTTAFQQTGLRSVTLPASVTTLGGYAFADCDDLKSVTLPATVTDLGQSVFAQCDALERVEIAEGRTDFGVGTFADCPALSEIVLPESLTTIQEGALKNCTSFTTFGLPDTITEIQAEAFMGCDAIAYLEFFGAPTLGENAFADTTTLTAVYCYGGAPTGIDVAGFDPEKVSFFYDPEGGETGWEDAIAAGYNVQPITYVGDFMVGGGVEDTDFAFVVDEEEGTEILTISTDTPLTISTNKVHTTQQIVVDLGETPGTAEITLHGVDMGGFATILELLSDTNLTIQGENTINSVFSWATNYIEEISEAGYITRIRIDSLALAAGEGVTLTITENSMGSLMVAGTDGGLVGENLVIQGGTLTADSDQESGIAVQDIVISGGIVTATGSTYGISGDITTSSGEKVGDAMVYLDRMTGQDTENWSGIFFVGTEGTLYGDSYTFTSDFLLPQGYRFTLEEEQTMVVESGATLRNQGIFVNNGTITEKGYVYTTDGGFWNFWTGNSPIVPPIFSYAQRSDGTIEITGLVERNKENSDVTEVYQGVLEIPAEYDGFTVTSIGWGAFRENEGLTALIIPDTVTKIGDNSFYACRGLTAITLGSGVTTIGENAFGGCYRLSAIEIPSGVTTLGKKAFAGCAVLVDVKLGSGLRRIGDEAFAECGNLQTISIPSGVTEIGADAFRASGLKVITYAGDLSECNLPHGCVVK